MSKSNENNFDPVLMAVLSNRIDGIVREMTNTLLRTARSAVINSARDSSCAICTGDHQLLAVAEGLPIHIFGSDRQSLEMANSHPDMAEGDCYLHNDPYSGNTHPADHAFLVPVFFEGEHMFTAVAKAHQADCGNSLPTTYMAVAKDVYEEGSLIFPATRVQRNYEMVSDIVRMIERRIRVPSQWYGDFLAGISAARVAEKRLKEVCEKYGRETIKEYIAAWFGYSEQRMVNAIRKLPAAKLVNTGRHDSTSFLPDGIPLKAEITVRPEDAIVDIDLRDNIDNIDCGYNQSESTATSSVLAGLFNALEGDVPKNAGSFRRVNVLLREGSVVGKPTFPHSCSVATTNIADRMVNLTGSAFAQLGDGYGLAEGALGPGIGMAVVSGTDPRFDNAPFVNQLHLCTNGGPASPLADGWVTYGIPVVAGLMYRDSVEVDELKHPIQVKRLSLMTGSGGAGRFRGAPGSLLEYGIKSDEMTVIYPGDGQETPPRGVQGGADGQLAERWVVRGDGEESKLPNAATVKMGRNDFVRGIDCSGGGYGSPLERDPARVLHDVLEKYETVERAARIYGVVFTSELVDEATRVDVDATQKKRAALAAQA
ncbi:hydantoinase B/oxoprolinase family protein [Paraburkholderia bannensis]|uniref:hydantoinase B/oxoprolinase family protein n=1 Tax=Paraburkholderia bannensis TaxID=765414 RepID=UPI002ABD6EFB|nr:hydantoinase B/oxoprolinase family protein [Paraburkholderia bannensis]